MASKKQDERTDRKGIPTGGKPGRDFNRQQASIEKLRPYISGNVILADDPEYDQARMVFYGGFDRRPTAVVRTLVASDVTRLVSFALENEISLAVRSGGHSNAGHGVVEGGIVLDLRDMKTMQIDIERRTAWADAGLTAGEYTSIANAHGLATGFGDTGSVGIGGITLGGGVGYLLRKYGLTIDNLLAAELVTADGKLLKVDAENHPDLFWAIRGGGGNFGVATRFKYQLHEVDTILGGMLILPATPAVIAEFMAAAEAAPDELSTIANVMPAPPMPFVPAEHHGKLIVMALMAYSGSEDTGQRVLAPFRGLAAPLADMLRPMRYPEMFPPEEGDYHPTAVGHTMFLDKVDLAAAEMMVEYLQKSDSPMRVVQLRALGGAMARLPIEATAFAHRKSRIMANLAAFYTGPEDRLRRQAWVEEFAADLVQSDHGAYVNFLGEESEARVRAAYPGSTWEHLREIKKRYDPNNFFRLNQNIPPAD